MNEKKKKETFQATQIIKLNLTKTGNCACDVSIFTPWRYSKEEAIWAEKEQWSRNNMPNRKWFCLPNLSFMTFWIGRLSSYFRKFPSFNSDNSENICWIILIALQPTRARCKYVSSIYFYQLVYLPSWAPLL